MRFIYFLFLLIIIISCNKEPNIHDNQFKTENIDSSSNRKGTDKFVSKLFYKSGILKKIGYVDKDNNFKGFVREYDSLGNLKMIGRYGTKGVTKNSLIEYIFYDSLMNINYKKSAFLKTIPSPVIFDTIYFSSKKSHLLNLKFRFISSHMKSYRIILQYSNKSDTLYSENKNWLSHTFNHLNSGEILDIKFNIIILRDNGVRTLYGTKKILKIL